MKVRICLQVEPTKALIVSASIQIALITFIILFSQSFCIGWAPLSYLVSAEIPSQLLRDHTTRIGFTIGIITQ